MRGGGEASLWSSARNSFLKDVVFTQRPTTREDMIDRIRRACVAIPRKTLLVIDNRPYQKQMTTVSQIECTNHLLRNLCKKLKVISVTTEPKMRRNRFYIKYRNVVKNNIKSFGKPF
ncbi:hypothetical protein ALC57_01540 [Trachymyrmex cornetzi]|uniref:Uncharacterized protein n=1 Tax=Trachymyrmex cornetzi TaxID=471704 RepID=A0A151JQ12_9HYME|nr:hypothetical protein ALC57_01540 [Trachymyrmex cornetzi]